VDAARTEPPSLDEFRLYDRPAGDRGARIDIAGIAVEFEGLPDDLADQMGRAYAPYLSAPTGRGRPLRVNVRQAPVEYFLPPGFTRDREVYRMLTALDGDVFRSVSYRLAAWFDVARGEGQIALGRGELDPAPRALENFLRSAVAWLAIDRGGFFLHGASIVRRGRCYLFYGPSGAGKSTLAAMSTEGRVISDDLTLILGGPEGLMAAGGPFRGTYRLGEPVVGTFPVAGFYRLRKGGRTAVEPDDGGCLADLIGNLPFVADQLPRRPEIMDRVRALVSRTPLHYLRFSKDAGFWPVIEAHERSPRRPPKK
jgi:hypothetical protein